MSILSSPGRRSRRVLLAAVLASAAPAAAQYATGAIVQPLPGADDPAEKLAAALRTLAVSPRDLSALIEAGRDALTLGDPNAAVGFFGRASEVSPRDGRVRAGLGAALVQLEKPREALRYFQEASALGVRDADLAEDRGLAYDLVGDPAHAQADYRTVLAAHPDDDAARRRLALSQGISGDRAGAIATLDPLIRKRDIAAWRAQTFVLAMTGDAGGANEITRIMLPSQQAMLQPFLERLATLSPADKARAVHFGEMPAAGRSYSDTQLASIGTPPTYAPAPMATRPSPVRTPAPVAVAPMRTAAPSIPATVRVSPVPATRVAASPSTGTPLAALASATPAATGRERFVSADGTPMRRIEHSAQEIFSLGLPRYEYVPVTDAAPPRAERTAAAPSSVVATAPVASPIRAAATMPATNGAGVTPSPAPVAALISAPAPIAPAVASPQVAAPTTVAAASPPASSAASPGIAPAISGPPAPTATAIAVSPGITPSPPPVTAIVATMPVGASGAEGHFDVPHEIADRRAVPRAAQPTARPPETVVEHPARAPAVTPPDRDAANPTVQTARRARTGGATELAAADRPVRSGHSRAVTEDSAPAEDAALPSRHARHEREADKGAPADGDTAPGRKDRHDAARASKGDTDDGSSADHKDRHGDHARTAAQDDDDARASAKTHGKDKSGKDKTEKAAPKVYVQVAGGANKADMDKAWAGVKAKAPDLMKGRTPSTTPLRATNRLLVGPFKDEDEAQSFVNKMAGKGLSGFTFKSEKGQKVEKVDTGG